MCQHFCLNCAPLVATHLVYWQHIFLCLIVGSRMSEPKIAQQWSSEEISVLLAIWSSTVIQEQFQRFKRKKKVYDQISQKMADAGFSRSALQIVNKLKKLKKSNDNASKTSIEENNKKARYDVMDAVLEHRLTGALNSATAMLETKTESVTSSEANLGEYLLHTFLSLELSR